MSLYTLFGVVIVSSVFYYLLMDYMMRNENFLEVNIALRRKPWLNDKLDTNIRSIKFYYVDSDGNTSGELGDIESLSHWILHLNKRHNFKVKIKTTLVNYAGSDTILTTHEHKLVPLKKKFLEQEVELFMRVYCMEFNLIYSRDNL